MVEACLASAVYAPCAAALWVWWIFAPLTFTSAFFAFAVHAVFVIFWCTPSAWIFADMGKNWMVFFAPYA